jgi:hypothetical protein
MGVIIEIQDEAGTTLATGTTEQHAEIVVNNSPVELGQPAPQSVVVEVMKGLPGVQNLHVGPTPPENPEENMVWIDTSE